MNKRSISSRWLCILIFAGLLIGNSAHAIIIGTFCGTVASGVDNGVQGTIDYFNLFGEGVDADLTGQVVNGTLSFDPNQLSYGQVGPYSEYNDNNDAGIITLTETINNVTLTAVSTGAGGIALYSNGRRVDIYSQQGTSNQNNLEIEVFALIGGDLTVDPSDINSINDVNWPLTGGYIALDGPMIQDVSETISAQISSFDTIPGDGTGSNGSGAGGGSSVPEPAGVLLFGTGLVALLRLREQGHSHKSTISRSHG